MFLFPGYQYANGDLSSPELGGGVYQNQETSFQSSVLGDDGDSSTGFLNSDNSVLSGMLNIHRSSR